MCVVAKYVCGEGEKEQCLNTRIQNNSRTTPVQLNQSFGNYLSSTSDTAGRESNAVVVQVLCTFCHSHHVTMKRETNIPSLTASLDHLLLAFLFTQTFFFVS